jgi:hypothetical protein
VHVPLPGVKVAVPVGVAVLVWSRSVTVAMQLVARLTTTFDGVQLMLVAVGICLTTGFIVRVIVIVVVNVVLVAVI